MNSVQFRYENKDINAFEYKKMYNLDRQKLNIKGMIQIQNRFILDLKKYDLDIKKTYNLDIKKVMIQI